MLFCNYHWNSLCPSLQLRLDPLKMQTVDDDGQGSMKQNHSGAFFFFFFATLHNTELAQYHVFSHQMR